MIIDSVDLWIGRIKRNRGNSSDSFICMILLFDLFVDCIPTT